MPSLTDIAKAVNRLPIYISGLQRQFELPTFAGASYPPAYLEFVRSIVALRTLNIANQTLAELWELEKKLLQLLHVDSNGSRTWFLDACGPTTHRQQRLLLSNHNLGMDLTAPELLQLGLDFAARAPELFAGAEMGEDALRVLRACLKIRRRILADLATELPHTRAAIHWAAPLVTRAPRKKRTKISAPVTRELNLEP